MELFINLAMTVIAGALIGYPLFVGKQEEVQLAEAGVDKKEVVFAALGEIEFDYRMRKLDDEEYQAIKSGYQQKALEILEREEEELDSLLEEKLQKTNTRNSAVGEKDE